MPNQSKTWMRALLFASGILLLIYAIFVLFDASNSYDIGIRSILSRQVAGTPKDESDLEDVGSLGAGDTITKIGSLDIRTWANLLQAPGEIARNLPPADEPVSWLKRSPAVEVRVEYLKDGNPNDLRVTWRKLEQVSLAEMVPSILWLFLKGSLFVVGALVYWKRPGDEAALRFYILCVITLGAYVGGYHWTKIVTQPALLLVFMVCAILLPVASLHFYLVFPRKNRWLEKYPRRTLLAVYGVPVANLFAMLIFYGYVRQVADSDVTLQLHFPWLINVTFGVAILWYATCIAALVHSWWTVEEAMERKQVRCVLFGTFLSMIPISYSLYIIVTQPDRFAAGDVTWPMFGASLIVTIAFAIGMTRYRLMEVDTIINSSVGYFLVTFVAALLYYGVFFVGTLFYSRLVNVPTLPAALTVSTTALLFVVALDLARGRIKKALDRRFSRNKSQLDQTLQQMSQAVSQLVDPPALSQRMLATIADTLGVDRGAVYLRQGEPAAYQLVASRGVLPPLQELPLTSPLAESLTSGLALEIAAPSEGMGTPSQKQLASLGAEAAQPLMHNGALLAILLLGPKDNPYRVEDWTLLSAFAQITVVALESAAQHRTIDQLHRDLQVKVDKIAEQQRRILTLQTQLRQTSAEKVVLKIEKVDSSPPETTGAGMAKASGIVGSSVAVSQLLNLVRKVASTDAVVLLRGESGTGKELLARAVHETSPRAAKPYVKLHCAALSPSLLESELFGHVKGAFTGAHKDKVGRFELAGGGTLFLDEIGDINLDVQTKLLRVLQEKTYERVGSSDPSHADVRIIAATHQNLEELIRQGRFREDLFYRLNVFPIQVPALRQRREDIPELVMFFLRQASERCRKTLLHLEDDALAALKAYHWPGNIRELENVIERAIVIAEGDTLKALDLPEELLQAEQSFDEASDANLGESNGSNSVPSAYRSQRDHFEREQVLRAIKSAHGNKSEAARILGLARSTLVSRMKKLGVS